MFWARINLRIPHSFPSAHVSGKKVHKPVLFLCHRCIPRKQTNADPPCITTASAVVLPRDAPRHLGTFTSEWFKLAEVPVLAAFFPFLTQWTRFGSQAWTGLHYVKKGRKAEGAKAITVGPGPHKKISAVTNTLAQIRRAKACRRPPCGKGRPREKPGGHNSPSTRQLVRTLPGCSMGTTCHHPRRRKHSG